MDPNKKIIMPKPKIEEGLKKILTNYGVNSKYAKITVNILMEGTLRGYFNHGIERIFQIIEAFEKKTLNPLINYSIKKTMPAIDVLDGNHSLGHPLAHQATHIAIKKAKLYGMGAAGVINSGHIGILSYYAELATTHNCIGICMSTSSPAMILPGGKNKVFGTNPICYSFPSNLGYPITADFSLTKASRGTIIQMLKENKEIPCDWAVDKNGHSTINPKHALEGGIQSLDGGYKGTALAFLVGVITGSMLGGVVNDKILGTRSTEDLPNKGDFFLVFHIESISSLQKFINDMTHYCKLFNNNDNNFRIPGSRANLHKITMGNQIPVSLKLSALLEKNT